MAQAKTPAPIDRPLSRAYLREFKGWSTAYPPGVSDSASLRVMHNCTIDNDGALRIRPGLRRAFSSPAPGDIIGEVEHFYLSGVPSLLFACKMPDGWVRFQVAKYNATTKLYDIQPNTSAIFPQEGDVPADFGPGTTYVRYVQIDNKILALSNTNETPILFTIQTPRKRKYLRAIEYPRWLPEDRLTVVMPAQSWIDGDQTGIPVAAATTTDTLISSDASKNVYNFAYFYTIYNELGESFASGNTVVKTQRPLSSWRTSPYADSKSADQLVAIIPQAVWNEAQLYGAVGWSLYMYTWSDQGVKPVEGVLLKSTDIAGKTYNATAMVAHTPLMPPQMWSHPVPSVESRKDNFTRPSTASQGLVAGDRLVLVNNEEVDERAKIQWSSNMQGRYLDFSPTYGGGYKTITSGTLYRPEVAVLWQNPQSADTITVLCSGPNGDGTAYYMNAGSSTTTQSQATVIMGFEETTATPGTVSPFGCQVLNNALYHPLENNLMKSTASNYNINHTMMADAIQNLWHRIPLSDKRRIVASQMDNVLYYLLRSPIGWLPAGNFNGNQLWLCDTKQNGVWSCWDVQGNTLRRLELGGLLYMAVTSGPNLYVLDPEYDGDDIYDPTPKTWSKQKIKWGAVTNTQGANRAHDAWSLLYQVSVTFGNFTGECVYGIRGTDRHGRKVEVKKHFISPITDHDPISRHDVEDHLVVRKEMKEWEFFWESAEAPVTASFGSISYVQYRYAPISVNVGYAYGDVESFEYGDRVQNYSNGTPLPFADTTKP